MGKKIYLIRHCAAEGQASEAKLTKEGEIQAEELAQFFKDMRVDRIISSPFQRALQTIQPLAAIRDIQIEMDDRLAERILSSENLVDWQSKLMETFSDLDLTFPGGESSRDAIKRIVSVVEDIFLSEEENTIIVTHGNLLSLFLHHIDETFGFDEWKALSNPDVFLVREGEVEIQRLCGDKMQAYW
ncbi:histidine phosphatase family protein [Anaerobacillus alkaliphilus]|uniref:Histidine phosphatase family protein n=1 Tax=Anaerobacillus alkaliphilus TaxID=1548597 RepID=A0A4Q0VQ37_9BACI|nr:histidine phosphatase family protein [Anaerobacillus alkaliphilus]RXI98612.1 histidine phosphatase family protein [Anaerobacillus alkaliphilus]